MNYYVIILGLVTAGGLLTTVWGLRSWLQTRRIARWPKTQGAIQSSTAQSMDDDLLPEIIYQYEVDGVQYSNKIELPSGTLPSQELSKRLILTYPVGKKVEVHYDSECHGSAQVEGTQGKGGDVFIILFGLASALFGALLIAQGI